jgi:hypothetical protein
VDPFDPLEPDGPADLADDARCVALHVEELVISRCGMGRPRGQYQCRHGDHAQEGHGILLPHGPEYPQMVPPGEARPDPTGGIHAHERERHRLDLGSDRHRRPDHLPEQGHEIVDGHAR